MVCIDNSLVIFLSITFDQFCEYLLPYKYAEHQELDFWKDSLRKKMIPILNEIHPEAIENNYTYYIASLINERINSKQTPIYLPHEYGYLFYNNILIDNIIFGSCSDYSNMELAYFRANGIPSIGEEFSNRGRNRDGVISKF